MLSTHPLSHSSMQSWVGMIQISQDFCDYSIQSDNTRVKIMKPGKDVFHQVENNFRASLKNAKMTVKKYWLPAKEEIIPAH